MSRSKCPYQANNGHKNENYCRYTEQYIDASDPCQPTKNPNRLGWFDDYFAFAIIVELAGLTLL